MVGIYPRLTKEYLLKFVSQEQIFEYYTGTPVQYSENICSPLRRDRNPTCRIYPKNDGGIWFVDYSGHFTGDAFDVVMYLFPTLHNFPDCLVKIASDLNIPHDQQLTRMSNIVSLPQTENLRFPHEKKDIRVKSRNWNKYDRDYWQAYGIKKDTLELFNVKPVQIVWVDKQPTYEYNIYDPAYAYWFAKYEYKIYFPFREMVRFISNTTKVQGYRQLPESGDIVCMTKALKDVMTLYELAVPSFAMQSESIVPSAEFMLNIQSRFKRVVTLLDFDWTGVRTSNKMRKLYGTEPMFITNGRLGTIDYGAKDVSDLSRQFGLSTIATDVSTILI